VRLLELRWVWFPGRRCLGLVRLTLVQLREVGKKSRASIYWRKGRGIYFVGIGCLGGGGGECPVPRGNQGSGGVERPLSKFLSATENIVDSRF
jgi:hypothetical protein